MAPMSRHQDRKQRLCGPWWSPPGTVDAAVGLQERWHQQGVIREVGGIPGEQQRGGERANFKGKSKLWFLQYVSTHNYFLCVPPAKVDGAKVSPSSVKSSPAALQGGSPSADKRT